MADDQYPPLVRVFITLDPLAQGEILEAWGRIEGDTVTFGPFAYRATGEGCGWHRQRWAAENYARQLQAERLTLLRAEVARLEGLRFGRPGR
ncbi:hypothetical protein MKK67_06330 [Methylobacterium sp. J-072]|uniref:hypothetical protein n=1 Tax=Methylobacterium sp. J-072 TaxID=2836651 RepID=UPI001FBA098F|nr:hypothetical protein [Methylobacterium sp. J-072]MCJ2092116.1 hypothetical protein [Methylobacterium sp. J-072]